MFKHIEMEPEVLEYMQTRPASMTALESLEAMLASSTEYHTVELVKDSGPNVSGVTYRPFELNLSVNHAEMMPVSWDFDFPMLVVEDVKAHLGLKPTRKIKAVLVPNPIIAITALVSVMVLTSLITIAVWSSLN